MKNLLKKWYKLATYLLLLLAFLLIGFIFFHNNKALNNVISSFFEVAENRSFDYRQVLKTIHSTSVPSKDIVILAIDDASLEILWEKYGEWPIPRNVYADIVNFIEKDNPLAIVFDLMFLKSLKSADNIDNILANTLNKYNNVYVAMNFDGVNPSVRTPENLPDRLALDIENQSNINIKTKYSFANCRLILEELLNGNVKVGMTNVIRNEDGIIRKVAPIMSYKDKYYPYLSFAVGNDCLRADNTKFVIDKKRNLITNNYKIPLTKDGDAILNWYGPSNTHTVYPMYKLMRQMQGKDNVEENDVINFENKIVIIGTTAMSLHDTKSVPVQEGIYPGVEVHATFLNNMLDNNFVKKTDVLVNIGIAFLVILFVIGIVMFSHSTIFALLSTILFGIAYLFVSYYALALYNIWIPVTIPVCLIVVAFAMSFIVKYIIKSRDFEYQYQLATVDGLTELYNHRYFQDTLRKQIEISKRYNQPFSILMTDIDFFKKFNDKYGHQAGDAVLKQVAQILKKNSRTTDYVCRYGGEEMCIILPNTDTDEAYTNAERILQAVASKDFRLNSNETGNVTISIGLATFPKNAETPQDLIEFADKGLYYAKEHGRNQVVRFQDISNN
ncbi:MAG: diguanylate cyclase [bacterium]|nr:diguanylate cyclase [bacterium]